MENSSPFSVTHSDQFFHQSRGSAFHAPGGPSGQHPHFIIGGGGYEDNNYNNLPDQPPSSTTFQPGQHVEPVVITADPIDDYSHLFDQPVDQDWLYSSNIDFDFSLDNYIHFDPTPQTQDINHNEALLHGGGVVATQTYSEATTITGTQKRQYKKWTHEEMSKLLGAIYKFRQSRCLWVDVKNNHFSADNARLENTLKQKFKEMCKAAAKSSGVKDPKTMELYNHALRLRGEIQQERASRNHSRGN